MVHPLTNANAQSSMLSRKIMEYGANSTVTGKVLYDDYPLALFTSIQPQLLLEPLGNPHVRLYPIYDSVKSAYSISNVPPGNWTLYASTWSKRPFPGDFDGFVVLETTGQSIINQDLSVQKIIHLTGPADNSLQIPVATGPGYTQRLVHRVCWVFSCHTCDMFIAPF